MKFVKWFSLFFVCICVSLIGGIYIGFQIDNYFYPSTGYGNAVEQKESIVLVEDDEGNQEDLQAIAVSTGEEKLDADTQYVLIERDMDTEVEVETIQRIPEKYTGLNREQFLENMEEYEANPPLSELERGFVSLEVLSFSAQEVSVLMNYNYVKPSNSFYIVVYDGDVVVLLEDKETVYMRTEMELFDLPVEIQQGIIQGMFVADEEALYGFLETYTS